ncbi:MAG TPA: aldose 1-epimerase family protein [Cyclobacteriaceae bacterium]|nr:aldose 1-epimerase family protein [Cyclobacteriaceae bacterium]
MNPEKILLGNDFIKAEVKLQGAELSSVLFNGIEYMWQADPQFWNRHSPILFPTVGSLIDNTFYVAGIPYHLPQHGFGRNSDFSLVEKTGNSAKFLLQSNEDTLKVYPFQFELYISYMLEGQTIQVTYEVKNPSEKEIYFGIGGHPGFNCPLDPRSENFEDYVIDFHDESDSKELYKLEGVYLAKGKYSLDINKGHLDLDYGLFANDALIIDTLPPAKISIKSKKTGAGVSMEYGDFKWLGIWTRGKGARYVCLEPWNGIADQLGHNQQFEEKLGTNRLAAGGTYTASYRVEFF